MLKRCNARFEYSGQEDPSRFSSEIIHPDEAMMLLYSIFEGVDDVPELPKLYRHKNPPNLVIFLVLRVVFGNCLVNFSFLCFVAHCCFCL